MAQGYTIKSNARRAARGMKADPEAVAKGDDGLWYVVVSPAREAAAPPLAVQEMLADDSAMLPARAGDEAGTKAQTCADAETPSLVAEPTETIPALSDKQAGLRAMLQRPEGATVAEICTALGWLAHTARGRISDLGRKHKFTIATEPVEGRGRVYRAMETVEEGRGNG